MQDLKGEVAFITGGDPAWRCFVPAALTPTSMILFRLGVSGTAGRATTPPLHDDDRLKDYIDRGFDLYGGLGRHPGMHTVFGLPKTKTRSAV